MKIKFQFLVIRRNDVRTAQETFTAKIQITELYINYNNYDGPVLGNEF